MTTPKKRIVYMDNVVLDLRTHPPNEGEELTIIVETEKPSRILLPNKTLAGQEIIVYNISQHGTVQLVASRQGDKIFNSFFTPSGGGLSIALEAKRFARLVYVMHRAIKKTDAYWFALSS